MPKLYLENGAVVEGSIDEIAELAKKLDCGEVEEGYRKISGREPRVGDFVKFIGDGWRITAGNFYEIEEIDEDGDYWFRDDNNGRQFVSKNREDVEFFERVSTDADEPEFKVGDYVKLSIPDGKSPAFGWGDVKNGDVGEVVCVLDYKIIVDFPNHKMWNAKHEELVKLTDREVPFAKAGRKLDEFKVGDIVRVIDGHRTDLEDYEGIIVEIDNVSGAVKPYHVATPAFVNSAIDGWMWADQLELITPVENRVDR